MLNLDGNHLGIPAMVHGIGRDTIFALAIPAIAALMIGALVFALIFQLAAKIVETAILGDPFVGDNATRLTRIGWLLVGLQLGSWCIHLALAQLPERLQDNIQFDSDFSPVGLLAILLVFVLAQVFRRGSEMRDELEGTV
jgi:sorbitol-specific phosphotransferase system component IIBC